MPRARTPKYKALSLEAIHHALSKVDVHAPEDPVAVALPTVMEEDHDVATTPSTVTTMQAITSGESTPFDDALHQYSMFARPTESVHLEELMELVQKLIQLCANSTDCWKIFLLVVFRRRYHAKAPEAAASNKRKKADEEPLSRHDDDDDDGAAVGDGERLIFYVTLLTLHRYHSKIMSRQDDNVYSKDTLVIDTHVQAAMTAMIRIATHIGGTRDLNAMIVHLMFATLLQRGHVTVMPAPADGDDGHATVGAPPGSFQEKLVPVLQEIVGAAATQDQSLGDDALKLAINLAAQQLDQDFQTIRLDGSGNSKNGDGGADSLALLLSTIHVTLPHNKRGTNTAKSWQRKLTNCVAEILIWQRTLIAQSDSRFSKALEAFSLKNESRIEQGHDLILKMQTTVRKMRKLLNDKARSQGFMLTSSYLMDKTSLTLQQLNRGKAGDLMQLQKLAKKQSDARMLKLITKRNSDPSKAQAVLAIDQLVRDWVPIPAESKSSPEDDDDLELQDLELQLQAGMLNATLVKLRPNDPCIRPVLVACLGHDTENQACAILVAAALDGSRLLLNGKEQDVSTNDKCLALLNQVIVDRDEEKDLLSIEEIISTKLNDAEDMIVLSSLDLELDENVLQDVQARGITIRVHSTKRIDSSKPVSFAINNDIHKRLKAGASLSLAVVLDCTGSMSGEIDGCKKGAISLISTFRDLAPVESANFLGYWDPVNVRSDPQPKSTGYLSPKGKDNMARIQKFVDTELKCQGGGDEPEDVPAALEKLVDDMKAAGLSADEGVHFVFFIADAGYRHNENNRVQAALDALKRLGVVMVMCPVRSSSSCTTMVSQCRECFLEVGQWIELNDVGELSSIAASVTESIRASLFKSVNVVSVTASVGTTIDVVGRLVKFQRDHSLLKEVEELSKLPDHVAAEPEGIVVAAKNDATTVFAGKKEFKMTSRDQMFLQLSRLPPVCHEMAESAFGGRALQEIAASLVADRLRDGNIPLSEVQKAGYPNDIVDLIRTMLGGHGIMRCS